MKSILIALAATALFSSIHLSSNPVGDDKQKNEKERVGRYQIEIVKKGEDHIIYRLDSFTGNVSVFDPNEDEILSVKDIENHKENRTDINTAKVLGYKPTKELPDFLKF